MQEAWVIKWRNLEESRISVCMGLDIRIKLVKHSISGKISSSFETLIDQVQVVTRAVFFNT